MKKQISSLNSVIDQFEKAEVELSEFTTAIDGLDIEISSLNLPEAKERELK